MNDTDHTNPLGDESRQQRPPGMHVDAATYAGRLGWRFSPGGNYLPEVDLDPEEVAQDEVTEPDDIVEAFGLFANFKRQKPHFVTPPIFGRGPVLADVAETRRWYAGYRAVPPEYRQARLHYLETAVSLWRLSLAELPCLELRAGIALALIVEEGLWAQIVDEHGAKLYRTGTEFMKFYMKQWGWGHTDTRCSRLRTTASLWLRLEGEGLPVPTTLSPLESFGKRADSVDIYRKLVEETGHGPLACRAVPSEWSIKVRLAELENLAIPKLEQDPVEPVKSRDEIRGELVRGLFELVNQPVVDIEAVRCLTGKLMAMELPPVVTEVEVAPATPKPGPYDPAWGCPLTLSEDVTGFFVHVAPLSGAFDQVFRQHLRRTKWAVAKGRTGAVRGEGRIIHIATSDAIEDEIHALLRQVNAWAEVVCEDLKAPAPVLLPDRPVVAQVGGTLHD